MGRQDLFLRCCGQNPGLCAYQASILPTEILPALHLFLTKKNKSTKEGFLSVPSDMPTRGLSMPGLERSQFSAGGEAGSALAERLRPWLPADVPLTVLGWACGGKAGDPRLKRLALAPRGPEVANSDVSSSNLCVEFLTLKVMALGGGYSRSQWRRHPHQRDPSEPSSPCSP